MLERAVLERAVLERAVLERAVLERAVGDVVIGGRVDRARENGGQLGRAFVLDHRDVIARDLDDVDPATS